MAFAFPETFLFGTATSATQIEGMTPPSDWLSFAREPGRVAFGHTPERACEHWELWQEDVRLQQKMKLHAHRLGLEWARIEPVAGHFSHQALDRYRQELGALKDAGIETMVTLHHFTLPPWLVQLGGVCAKRFPALLARFATHVADALGDLVDYWITINEPNALMALGYLFGIWPPGKRGRLDRFLLGQHRLLEAHTKAYRALHHCLDRRNKRVAVGLAQHLRALTPARPDVRADRWALLLQERFFNQYILEALIHGEASSLTHRALSNGTSFRVEEAKGCQDFVGINYYSRATTRLGFVNETYLKPSHEEQAEVSDLGWEIFPEGLGDMLIRWGREANLPVFVTENGIADASDEKRPRFIIRHLQQVQRALQAGIDVRGYFHWSLLDNFEWAEGYSARFGLVEVDYRTQERRLRKSAHLYSEIASRRILEDDLGSTP